MLSELKQYWSRTTMGQKISTMKRILIEAAILITISIVFFWSTFIFIWMVTYLVGVQPYQQQSTPTFHIRQLLPSSLVTLYTNPSLKAQACQLAPTDPFFSQLTVPYHQYCNIDQQKLPKMRAPVDVTISNLDPNRVEYVNGCIKGKGMGVGRDVSCQRYPVSSSGRVGLFRNLQFQQLYYLMVEVRVKAGQAAFGDSIMVEFYENCWMITKLFKKYYNVVVFLLSYGITCLLTICAITYRLYTIIASNNPSNPSNSYIYNSTYKDPKKRHNSSRQGPQVLEPQRTMMVNPSLLKPNSLGSQKKGNGNQGGGNRSQKQSNVKNYEGKFEKQRKQENQAKQGKMAMESKKNL